MRRDWDYVSMEDYQSDMREATERSVSIVAQLRRERDEARRMIVLVVEAAGGRVAVHEGCIRRLPDDDPVFIKEYDPQHMDYILRTKKRTIPRE